MVKQIFGVKSRSSLSIEKNNEKKVEEEDETEEKKQKRFYTSRLFALCEIKFSTDVDSCLHKQCNLLLWSLHSFFLSFVFFLCAMMMMVAVMDRIGSRVHFVQVHADDPYQSGRARAKGRINDFISSISMETF